MTTELHGLVAIVTGGASGIGAAAAARLAPAAEPQVAVLDLNPDGRRRGTSPVLLRRGR